MAGIKELRVRIKSVGGIKQITRAMEMVASTKLRRFQDRALASRPYAQEIAGLVGRLAGMLGSEAMDMPLFRPGQGDKTLVLVVSSDRGLCGPYNTNIGRAVEQWMLGRMKAGLGGPESVEYCVYGRRAQSFLLKRGRTVTHFFSDPPMEKVDYRAAAVTARILQKAFLSGAYRDVVFFYTAFESVSKFVPRMVQFLPLTPEALIPRKSADEAEGEGARKAAEVESGPLLLEPDGPTIFNQLVPRYLESLIYNGLIESITSEYASRRFAMKNATDAASDQQAELKKVYNRKRQENITKELLDIVGGAEAVK
jgi:F-type H+-transporting ATPase subunit gamma